MGILYNQVKTGILLASMTAILLFTGNLFGGYSGLLIAFIFACMINFGMYFFSDKIVLWMYQAKEEPNDSKLYVLVKEVANKAKIPMPKVYLIKSTNPNAFATGRSPSHSAVACTEGILHLLSDRELKAVIAHEIGHIKNRDTLITAVAAVIAGVIGYMASMVRWAALFGGFGGRDDRNGPGLFEMLAIAIVAPLIATLLQLAISRAREFIADETGAKIVHDPIALADALAKIEAGVKAHPMQIGSETTSSLFIANPFKGNAIFNLFSTHPPMEERIKRLKALKI